MIIEIKITKMVIDIIKEKKSKYANLIDDNDKFIVTEINEIKKYRYYTKNAIKITTDITTIPTDVIAILKTDSEHHIEAYSVSDFLAEKAKIYEETLIDLAKLNII
jgi:hypothetical protein